MQQATLCKSGSKGGFPLFRETTRRELARGTISCDHMSMTFNEHRPSCSFKLRLLNKAITNTLQLTEHANIVLNTCPVVVISHLSLQPLLLCTRRQKCLTIATIRSFDHFEHVELPLSLDCDVAFTCCE